MKTFFIFFSICIVSAFASTPWLNENSTDSGISEGDIAFEDAPDSNEHTAETEDHQGHRAPSEMIRKWENKIVPFNIPLTFDKKQKAIILAAMAEVEDNTCISFVPRQLQKDYILFKKLNHGSICSSIVGRLGTGGRQHVNLTDECIVRNTVLHELMHVLGFHHENSRQDRDKHIEIDLINVKAEHKLGLKVVRKLDPNDLSLPYDYKSITHYPVDAYSTYTNRNTIRSKFPWFKIKADGLSDIDIWKIKYMYNCSDSDEPVKSSNEHAEDTTINVPNTDTTTVDQQIRYHYETSTIQKTTSQMPTIQSTNKLVQSSSSTVMSAISVGTTSKMTTSTTTRPISVLNNEIIAAVEEGNETRVEQLLNEGADVNASIEYRTTKNRVYKNETLLQIASKKGHVNVVSLLLDKGANIEARDASSFTPLYYAALSGHGNVVLLLLDKGANIEARDTYNRTLLYYAALSGHVNIVSLLLYKGANIEAKGKSYWTPLHSVADKGDVNVVSLLLDKGANIEARTTYNSTALHIAARNGHVNVVSLLLDKRANIEARDKDDWTPLHFAARYGHVNVVSVLLYKGANIFAKGRWNNVDSTPLDLVKRSNEREIVEILERKQRQLTG